MKPGLNQPVRWTARFDPPASNLPPARKFISKPISALALTAITLTLGALPVLAQQPYGYGAYSGQYAAPAQPYGYAQPQYQQQPQYPQQPQYAQPQYQDPQYAQQPQYAQPQYSDPQYVQPQYQDPQYAQQPQYAQPQYQQQPDNAQPQYVGPQQSYADQGQPGEQLPDLSQPDGAPPQQPLSAADLEQLLAPVALYPDNLLAQILAASTYPAQVAVADQWVDNMKAQGYGSPDQIAAGAQSQSGWDPSVKALTAFPQVLDMLNQNLQWTTALGNAYYNQPQDVMQTVQVLRQRAEQAGNLQNTPQEDVTNDQGYIEVAPSNPQVVYVPEYNPWAVYGQPVAAYPGFSLLGGVGAFFGASPIQFGLGVALSAFEHMPFGWMGWGLSWLAHSIFFNHSPYLTHSNTVADWGLPHGGQRVFGDRGLPINRFRMPQANGRYGGYQSARGGSYARPGYAGAAGQRGEGYMRGNEGYMRGNAYTHPEAPGQMAYNRGPEQYARPQAYANRPQAYAGGAGSHAYSGYGYGYANRPAQSYAARPGGYSAYRSPSYSAPAFNASRAYGGRGAYGESFAQNQRSGGVQMFGGRESGGFEGGRAPKSFSSEGFGGGRAPKNFGHENFGHENFGHESFGHQSFGHEKAPKASHSGGGHGHHR